MTNTALFRLALSKAKAPAPTKARVPYARPSKAFNAKAYKRREKFPERD